MQVHPLTCACLGGLAWVCWVHYLYSATSSDPKRVIDEVLKTVTCRLSKYFPADVLQIVGDYLPCSICFGNVRNLKCSHHFVFANLELWIWSHSVSISLCNKTLFKAT